ncbi:UDP-glucose 4-epimerase [compost metagenome]
MPTKVLVTGGAGYIGSHTCLSLLEAGYSVVSIDNYSNSSPIALKQVELLTGKEILKITGDFSDVNFIEKILTEQQVEQVIHFAGLKAVGESVQNPLAYYHNNVTSTVNLCQAMKNVGVKDLVFSSSATVYGSPDSVPIHEGFNRSAENPYGRSKLTLEYILEDLYHSDNEWNIALLRYFNPVGAHISGKIGEDPLGPPNNLMPFIAQVAVGRRPYLSVFGGDYPTPDGTGVRDYIHVMDLALGHVKALTWLQSNPTIQAFNLGTGIGYSVLDMLKAFEESCGETIPYKIVARRPGDIAICYADTSLAEKKLDWKAKRSLSDMCSDTWNWQKNNPNGYIR